MGAEAKVMSRSWQSFGPGRISSRTYKAAAWFYVPDNKLVVRHCCHPTALRPYFAEYADVGLTKYDLCRSMAVVNGWQSTEEEFAAAARQLLAVRNLKNMQDIAAHWLQTRSN